MRDMEYTSDIEMDGNQHLAMSWNKFLMYLVSSILFFYLGIVRYTLVKRLHLLKNGVHTLDTLLDVMREVFASYFQRYIFYVFFFICIWCTRLSFSYL